MPIIRGIFKAMKIERVRLSNGFKHKNGQYYYVELFGYQPEKVKLHLAQDAVETNDFPKSLPVHELFAKDKVSRKDVLKGMEALIEEFNDMH